MATPSQSGGTNLSAFACSSPEIVQLAPWVLEFIQGASECDLCAHLWSARWCDLPPRIGPLAPHGGVGHTPRSRLEEEPRGQTQRP